MPSLNILLLLLMLFFSLPSAIASPSQPANSLQNRNELQAAAIQGKIDIVKQLLDKGVNPNHTSALIGAAKNGRLEIIKLLLPTATGEHKEKAMWFSAQRGDIEIVKLFLAENIAADIEPGNRTIKTPLLAAISQGRVNVVELLLQHKADPNKAIRGNTPLHQAVLSAYGQEAYYPPVPKEAEKIIHLLLEHGAYLNERNITGFTPEQLARRKNLLAIESTLKTAAGKYPKNRTRVFQSALLHAIDEGDIRKLSRLLDSGIDVNEFLERGMTALFIAVRAGDEHAVSLLLNRDAEKEPASKFEDNPLYDAILLSHPKVIDVLINTKPKYSKRTLNKALLLSAEKKNLELLEKFLIAGAKPNAKDNQGRTAFMHITHWPLKNKNFVPAVQLLLKYTADPFMTSRRGESAFNNLIRFHSPTEVALNAQRQALNDIINSAKSIPKTQGERGLLWAVKYREPSIAELLLKKDISPNINDKKGVSAIKIAYQVEERFHIEKRSVLTLELLLKYGAKANEKLLDKIMWIVLYNNHSPEVISLLLENGLDPNFNPDSTRNYLETAIKNNKLESARILLAHGANVNLDTLSYSLTRSLYLAAGTHDVELVRLIIKHGAELDAVNTTKLETALFAAVGNLDILTLLHKAGADINKKNSAGETPLHRAYKKGNRNVIEYLLQHGAEMYSKKSPIEIASAHHNHSVLRWLLKDKPLDKKTFRQALSKATRSNNVETIIILLQQDTLHKAVSKYAYKSAWLRSEEYIRQFIKAGIDVNSRYENNETPLMWAAERGSLGSSRLLLSNGADVNAVDNRGENPLFKVISAMLKKQPLIQRPTIGVLAESGAPQRKSDAQLIDKKMQASSSNSTSMTMSTVQETINLHKNKDHLETIKLILQSGANLDAQENNNELTSLMLASQYGLIDVAKLLLQAGARIEIRNKYGKTAADLAQESGHTELAKLLH